MEQTTRGNVLLVSNYPSDVGYAWWLMEHFWTLIAEYFEAQGGKAFLAYPSITELPERIRKSSIIAVEMKVYGAGGTCRKSTQDFIKAHGIRHVYLTDRPWFNAEYAFLRRAGVKNIVVHDHTPGDRPPIVGWKGALKAIRNRIPLVCADSQLCVSKLMRERSIRNGRIPSRHCHVVQNGILPIEKSKIGRQRLVERFNLPRDSRICITTGRAHPYKRFDFIIETACELQKLMPDNNLVFLLIGDGPAYPELLKKVEHLGLQEKVRLPGFTADARELLSCSDMAMHAALGEGFSLSIIEYMSAGLPVLVPDIPSVKQAIDHGENGYVFPAQDASSAASYVANLLRDEQNREYLGARAKNKADRQFSLENCTLEFRNACRALF